MKKTLIDAYRKLSFLGNEDGMVIVIVMAMITLMLMGTLYLANMIMTDTQLIARTKTTEQARYLAEAGVSHALAGIKDGGFATRAPFSDTMDTGSYSVTYDESTGRILIISVGTVSGVSRTVTAEIEGLLPSALTKIIAGGNNVKLRASSSSSSVTIDGDIHANNNVELRTMGSGTLDITGEVSATGIVKEGSKHNKDDNRDNEVYINGLNDDAADVSEGAARIVFPVFNYEKYKQEAIDAGDYYAGDTNFLNQTLTPASGAIYVDGKARFWGACTINGGIIAEDIKVFGSLDQVKAGDRNIIVAKERDVLILGRLTTEEAIVYAKRDFSTLAAGTEVDVNGVMLAERDISFWNVQTTVIYNYLLTYPSDLGGVASEDLIDIISWNR